MKSKWQKDKEKLKLTESEWKLIYQEYDVYEEDCERAYEDMVFRLSQMLRKSKAKIKKALGLYMTTVVYERLGGKVICHVTRDQKKTVCGKNARLMSDLYAGSVPETNCKKCWAKFNG